MRGQRLCPPDVKIIVFNSNNSGAARILVKNSQSSDPGLACAFFRKPQEMNF